MDNLDECKLNVIPEPKNVREIIKLHLIQNGFDGLYNPEEPCDCLVLNLAPCGEPDVDCMPGYRTDFKAKDQCGCVMEGTDHWHIGQEKPHTINGE